MQSVFEEAGYMLKLWLLMKHLQLVTNDTSAVEGLTNQGFINWLCKTRGHMMVPEFVDINNAV